MLDNYNRNINYMRISLTDRCNLRCVYCRPEVMQMVEHTEILRYEELLRVAKCALALGITHFKITGGEPLVRKGAIDFIAKLKALIGVEQVTLTTNGTLLEQYLPQLLACGIEGINISIDTLDSEAYTQITGGGKITPALQAIEAAVHAGIKCKLNCVPLRSLHAKGLGKLVEYAHSLQVPLRFIELMPLACNNKLFSYSGSEIRKFLAEAGYKLEQVTHHLGNGPAVYYEATKYAEQQIIGFIEPLHQKFCGSCNRIRLTSTGQLKPCLYSNSTLDLRQLLRSGVDDAKITEALKQAIYNKPMGHHFEDAPAAFSMNEIGG
ncbi:MAG: GTP 3',8-cyclase MoaA [Phascolarctobacterium sp.]